jgi:hypothetical protein
VGAVVVSGHEVAQEMRRRRVGRPSLVDQVEAVNRSTWLPSELPRVPTSLLVLAAVSLARQGQPGRPTPTRSLR